MSEHPIPDAALALHSAFLGMTGSGKTSTAKLAVEQVVAQGARVCVLDPIKSDWWGITSSADGRAPGLPFLILGGPHGHLPLAEDAGEAVAHLIADGTLTLSVLDMADFGPGAHAAFFVAFSRTLLRRNAGVVYLVVEEAHEFAPKQLSGIGPETQAIHWAKKLATAGRSRGIRLIVATQRAQALHNALLGSCQALFAHRTQLPADRKPIAEWLRGNLAKDQAAEIEGSLPGLPTGTGWTSVPLAGISERVAFPRIATFDNTATPEIGAVQNTPIARAPVDVDAIRAALAVVAQPEAHSKPTRKVLKTEFESAPSGEALAAAERRGYERGLAEGARRGGAAIGEALAAIEQGLVGVLDEVVRRREDAKAGGWAIRQETARLAAKAKAAPQAEPRESEVAPAQKKEASHAPKAAGAVPPARQRILNAIAWANATDQPEPTREVIAFLCRVSFKSGGYRNNLSALHTAGLIRYPGQGTLALTAAGLKAARAPAAALDHAAMLERVAAVIAPARLRILEWAIGAWPSSISREDLAAACNVSAASGGFRNNLSGLSSLGLVTYPASGLVRAADLLFPGRRS